MFVGYPRGIAVRGYLGPRDVTRKGAAGQRDAFFCAAAAVPKTVALAARIEPVVRMKRQRNPGASTQGSQVVPGFHFVPSGLQRCWRNNQHKTFSRRDLRPSFAHGGERRMARSPDERPAKSGAGLQARKPLPDFTEPVIGPATSGRTRWFHPGHERKGGGTPADAYLQPPHPQPSSFPLAGEDRGGGAARVRRGRARLSAFHRGSCLGDPTPPLSSGYALPGTQPRRVLAALRLSQSSELLADRS